jgi:signal transduction histidine kinase
LFSGLALSGMLFVVTRGQVTARIDAETVAEELRRSEERLLAADRAKDEFLATVSHELRTPLNAIVGWASMLSRGAVPSSMHGHAIAVIARNAAAQTRLVEDLLDMSRAVAGHLQLRLGDVDPRVVLQGAIDALRPVADEAGLALEYRPGANLCHIRADAGRLQQVVNNLLSNSLKFTPRGGRVSVHADCVDDSFLLTVEDTGIGIEPDFVPFVFDRFRQADSSSTRAHAGAGLGLAIARHLVELHGGSIAAASEGRGRGSTFTVRLPVDGASKSAA